MIMCLDKCMGWSESSDNNTLILNPVFIHTATCHLTSSTAHYHILTSFLFMFHQEKMSFDESMGRSKWADDKGIFFHIFPLLIYRHCVRWFIFYECSKSPNRHSEEPVFSIYYFWNVGWSKSYQAKRIIAIFSKMQRKKVGIFCWDISFMVCIKLYYYFLFFNTFKYL